MYLCFFLENMRKDKSNKNLCHPSISETLIQITCGKLEKMFQCFLVLIMFNYRFLYGFKWYFLFTFPYCASISILRAQKQLYQFCFYCICTYIIFCTSFCLHTMDSYAHQYVLLLNKLKMNSQRLLILFNRAELS